MGLAMHQQDAALTPAEADHRKGLLGLLQDALAGRRVTSALAGRRTLVLRWAADSEGDGSYPGPVGLTDPQLYVFVADGVHIVTTDGDVYRLDSGYPHPVADPGGAAQVYARWRA
jgi:hypothetical protein